MKTITFYSYKGGVGRSLALVNIATRLSEFNKKVCIIDFDLEAPGLPLKLTNLNNDSIKKGIVDYIYEFSNSGLLSERISDFSISFNLPTSSSPIFLIPAGNIDSSDYWKKLSSINWFDLIYQNNNGLAFFLDLKEKIKKEINPDFLLIDSRTGISEMSGITLSLMADEVVVVAANNNENLTGAKKVIQSLSKPDNSIFGRMPRLTFVLSRIPFTDKPEDRAKEQNLISKIKHDFSSLIDDINVIHSDRELEENEKIKIGYEISDTTAQISRDYLRIFEKLTQDILSKEEVNKFNNIKESEKLYQKSVLTDAIPQKLELINKAINLNKGNVDFYIYRGQIHCKLSKYDEGLKDFYIALELNEGNLAVHELISIALLSAYRFEEAEIKLSSLISWAPKYFKAYLLLGTAQSYLGKHDLAIKNYNIAIDLNPYIAEAYNNRANEFRLKGDYDKALQDIYKALELDSELAIAYATLAELNFHLNNLNEFYIHLEIALKLDRNNKTEIFERLINREKFYRKFNEDERFLKLLEKYNIVLQ